MPPMPSVLSLPFVPGVCEGTPLHPGKEGPKSTTTKKEQHFPPEQDVCEATGGTGGNLTAVLTGFKTFELEDRPVPVLKDDEILIRVMATGM